MPFSARIKVYEECSSPPEMCEHIASAVHRYLATVPNAHSLWETNERFVQNRSGDWREGYEDIQEWAGIERSAKSIAEQAALSLLNRGPGQHGANGRLHIQVAITLDSGCVKVDDKVPIVAATHL